MTARWMLFVFVFVFVLAAVAGAIAYYASRRQPRLDELIEQSNAILECQSQRLTELACEAGDETSRVKCAKAFEYLMAHDCEPPLTWTDTSNPF